MGDDDSIVWSDDEDEEVANDDCDVWSNDEDDDATDDSIVWNNAGKYEEATCQENVEEDKDNDMVLKTLAKMVYLL